MRNVNKDIYGWCGFWPSCTNCTIQNIMIELIMISWLKNWIARLSITRQQLFHVFANLSSSFLISCWNNIFFSSVDSSSMWIFVSILLLCIYLCILFKKIRTDVRIARRFSMIDTIQSIQAFPSTHTRMVGSFIRKGILKVFYGCFVIWTDSLWHTQDTI